MRRNKIKIELTKKYVVSRSVNISVSEQGKFVVYNSLSRPLKEINIDHLLILNTFLNPIAFEAAYNLLREIYNLTKPELKIIVEQFLNLNIITADQTIPSDIASSETGFASIGMHHFMIRDTVRVMAYKTAIMSIVKGKSVIDLGCGTGILSIFAAKSGATCVTAIEESNIATIAEKMFKANKVNDLITLKRSNSKDVVISKKADVLIHEIIGMDPLDENILTYISDAKKRLLKKGGELIPNKMEIYCIAYEEEVTDYFAKETETFVDLYGISFEPYIAEMENTPIENLRNYISVSDKEFGGRKEISEETLLYNIDFNSDFTLETGYKKKLKLKTLREGVLSGLLVYFKAHLTDEIILSTSPFSKPTHWAQKNIPFKTPLKVTKNLSINLNVEIKNENGKHKIEVNLV